MSKAFDTVNRLKLINMLEPHIPKSEFNLIKLLLQNTTLQVKNGKIKGEKFISNIGVPQGDCLSPKLFTFYLDQVLKKSRV